VTYNAGLLRAFFKDIVPFVGARAKLLPSSLEALVDSTQIDVLFLQEVWSEKVARRITSSLEERHYTVVRPRLLRLFGSGMLIAIRQQLHLIRKKFIPFRVAASTDYFAAKGVLVLHLMSSDKTRFLCVGTHMQSIKTRNGIPQKKVEVEAHSEQIKQLKAILDLESEGRTIPVVLLGDFNVGPGYAEENFRLISQSCDLTEAYMNYRPVDFEHTWDVRNPLVKAGWNSLEPSALIDHCFVRPGKKLFWKMTAGKLAMKEGYSFLSHELGNYAAPLSDHYALVTDLELA
jgi:endonuclease/exonuclease/phosphatase family metal-dependent hydrolase